MPATVICLFSLAESRVTEVSVPGLYRYKDCGIVLSFKQSVILTVKISSNAHIALTTYKDNYDGDVYEIVIGSNENTTSIIR